MSNPFENRQLPLSGPATDLVPVTPSDTVDFPAFALALFVEAAGSLSFVTVFGQQRTINVPDNFILPVGVRRVNATGTTAQRIHAMLLV